MDAVLLKTLQTNPKIDSWPAYDTFGFAFKSLPDFSPLYRFFMEVAVHGFEPLVHEDEEMTGLVLLSLSALAYLSRRRSMHVQRLKCDDCEKGVRSEDDGISEIPEYSPDICAFHKHNSEVEKKDHRNTWKGLIKAHDVYIVKDFYEGIQLCVRRFLTCS